MYTSETERYFLFDRIFQYIQDGIIVMNESRDIMEMNPAAKQLTGWKKGEKVPYCTYCRSRIVKEHEERCYLVGKKEVPYFLSEMPTYKGENIEVEMSTALLFSNSEGNEQLYLLVLRDQSLKQKEEEARIAKLMIKQLIEAKEEEHQRLAQELHDGVGQSLYSISIALKHIEKKIENEELIQYTRELRDDVSRLLFDVKNYSYYLRPKSLDELGLAPTIRNFLHNIQHNVPKITFSFQCGEEQRWLPEIEINLYRVVQEAVLNAIKYAKASHIDVSLSCTIAGITLQIIDDGIGIKEENRKLGLGLKHMEERLSMLEGTFSIHTTEGQGTTIQGFIPIDRVDA
ncbi:MAG: ATP-binding protein [Bacillaceae bacterium]